jgi:hypothetical protein
MSACKHAIDFSAFVHTEEYNPFIKSQVADTQLTLAPYVVHNLKMFCVMDEALQGCRAFNCWEGLEFTGVPRS